MYPGTPQIHDRKIKTDFYSTQITTVPVHRVQVRLYRCVRVYVYYFYKLQLLPVVHTCVCTQLPVSIKITLFFFSFENINQLSTPESALFYLRYTLYSVHTCTVPLLVHL